MQGNLFDQYEALNLLHALLRFARTENHSDTDKNEASLDEIRAGDALLDDTQLQCLFVGLLGNPIRAKVAKDAGVILKNAGDLRSYFVVIHFWFQI